MFLDFTSVPQFQGVQVKFRAVKGHLFELKEISIVHYIVPLQNTTVHSPSPSPSLSSSSSRHCCRRHCRRHHITIVVVASVAAIIAVVVVITSPLSRGCRWCRHPHHCHRRPCHVHCRLLPSSLAVCVGAPPWLCLTYPPPPPGGGRGGWGGAGGGGPGGGGLGGVWK